MKRVLLLVDGNNLTVRASYAMQDRELSAVGPEGELVPTAALLAAINMLAKHVRLHRPEALVVCWDGGKSDLRREIYPAYKAHRPDDPAVQVNRPFFQFKRFLEAARIQQAEVAGWEGDDLIAAYVAAYRDDHATNPGSADYDRLVIASDDKDLLQLVGDPDVTQMRLGGVYPGDFWDAARVRREHGCEPAQLRHLMALVGDPGDGVLGLRGVGPKRGVARLEKHGFHWPAVLDSVERDFGAEGRQTVCLALRLVDLVTMDYGALGLSVATPYPLWPTVATPADERWAELETLLERYRMESILGQLREGRLWGSAQVEAELGD